MGEVEEVIVVPSDESHPCPKEVCPVPPFPTERVPVMVERVDVATQPGIPFTEPRTNPPVPMPSFDRTLVADE